MLLTKSRIPVALGALILLMGLLFALSAAVRADNSDTSPFGDVPATSTDVAWSFTTSGTQVQVKLYLYPALAGQVSVLEVFLKPTTTGTKPAFTQQSGSPFPTGQILTFTFDLNNATPEARATAASPLLVDGIHLTGSSTVYIRKSSAQTDSSGVLVVPAPPVVPPAPTPTPLPTTVVPIGSIKVVAALTGGATVIVQPNATATLSAPDGSVVVNFPITSASKTFQLVYAPATTGVPAATGKLKIIRAFDLTSYDSDGNKATVSILNPVTIIAKYTNPDAAAALNGSATNLRILSYDSSTGAWTTLTTSVDIAAQTLTAQTTHFSFYAVGSQDPGPQTPADLLTPTATPKPATPTPTPTATATPTPRPPVTGDFAPSSGMVLGMLIIGFLLVTGGSTYLAQTRKSKA